MNGDCTTPNKIKKNVLPANRASLIPYHIQLRNIFTEISIHKSLEWTILRSSFKYRFGTSTAWGKKKLMPTKGNFQNHFFYFNTHSKVIHADNSYHEFFTPPISSQIVLSIPYRHVHRTEFVHIIHIRTVHPVNISVQGINKTR